MWVVKYRSRYGVEEFAIAAGCLNECRRWVGTLNYCTFLGAFEVNLGSE